MPTKWNDRDPFDPEKFRSYVLTWETARLKDGLKLRKTPSSFEQFKEWLDGKPLEIKGVVEGITIRECFCGKNPHTEDCLTWPHLTLKLIYLDGKNGEVSIHSLWMEPVTFKKTENDKNNVDEIESSVENASEIVAASSDEVIEKREESSAEPTIVSTIEGSSERFQSKEVHSQAAVALMVPEVSCRNENMELTVVHVDSKGLLTICSLDEFTKENDIVVDCSTQTLLFGEAEGAIGEIVLLGNNHEGGFIIVMEGKVQQIQNMAQALLLCRNFAFKEEIREAKEIVSKLLDSMSERF